ncbi:MAG: hypothetical protein RLY71_3695 [Pseudomonadota bacterium]|jgi:two-component system response regulator DctR
MTLPTHPTDPTPAPAIHIVDDYADFRDGLAYTLRSHGLDCVTWASGEAFLAGPVWPRRGVVILDIDFEPPGSMNGLQIFGRLLQQRCPMPVIFLTGPHGHDVRLAVEQVTRRADVDYFSKQASVDRDLLPAIRRFLEREPGLRRAAEHERRVLQAVLDELTPAEREVIGRVLRGQTNYGIARELGKEEGVVELQRASAMRKLLGDSRSPQLLAQTLQPLLERHRVGSVTELARHELLHRLGLLDALARDVLMAAAEGRSDAWIARAHGWLDEHDRQRRHRERVREHLDRALALMQADTTRQVRKWLAWLGDPPDEAATVDGPGDTGGPCKPSSASPLPSSPSS